MICTMHTCICATVADNPPCITIVLGGGQMGCKTQAEWEKVGSIQCGVRVTTNATYHHATKVPIMKLHVVYMCNYLAICTYYALSTAHNYCFYMQAHHHCTYDRYKPEHTFMQAEINCCPAESTTASMNFNYVYVYYE